MTYTKLRELRLKRGISAAHVAKQLGISRAYLCDMEHGRRPMSSAHSDLYLKAIGGAK